MEDNMTFSGRHKVPFTFSDPNFYIGPYIPGWPPSKNRNLTHYIHPNSQQWLMQPRPALVCDCALLILVQSAPELRQNRETIRRTWASGMNRALHRMCVVFVLGFRSGISLAEELFKEQEEDGDLLQADFIDSYFNLTLKSVFGLKFLTAMGEKPKYIFKVDDDCFVNIHALMEGITKIQNKLTNRNTFIMGHVFGADGEKIMPYRANPGKNLRKWDVPSYMFNGSEYPQMVSGAGYVMSLSAALCIYKRSIHYPFLHLEDVFVTGFAAQDCNVTFVMHWGFKAWTSKVLEFSPTDILFHYSINKEKEILHKILSYDLIKEQYEQLIQKLGKKDEESIATVQTVSKET